jgi:hypothetical protein
MTVTIHTGDCREVMRGLNQQIDVVITDPVWPNCPPELIASSGRDMMPTIGDVPNNVLNSLNSLPAIGSALSVAVILVDMNDSGKSFAQIADWIEENL